MSKNTFETWLPKLVVTPAFVLGFAFIYGLMVWNGVLSLSASRMLPNYEWVGLAQYEKLWEMDRWWVALKNLGIFGVGYVGGSLAIGVVLAEVQEEILWACEAAHMPVVWATQVLENQAKTGRPSRAEITDAALAQACLPEELWGHACLYSGDINACVPSDENLRALTRRKFGRETGWPQDDATPLWLFQTKGVFVEGEGPVQLLDNEGVMDRVRRIDQPDATLVAEAVQRSADYLTRQVTLSGRWVYGWYPCFDRPVPSYNALRHASAAYSLLEAWDLTRQPAHLEAATRAIDHLCRELIKPVAVPAGEAPAAYLVDEGAEIKLGGNGVAILALSLVPSLTAPPAFAQAADPATGTVQALHSGLLGIMRAGSAAVTGTGNGLANKIVGNELDNQLSGEGGADLFASGHAADGGVRERAA